MSYPNKTCRSVEWFFFAPATKSTFSPLFRPPSPHFSCGVCLARSRIFLQLLNAPTWLLLPYDSDIKSLGDTTTRHSTPNILSEVYKISKAKKQKEEVKKIVCKSRYFSWIEGYIVVGVLLLLFLFYFFVFPPLTFAMAIVFLFSVDFCTTVRVCVCVCTLTEMEVFRHLSTQ